MPATKARIVSFIKAYKYATGMCALLFILSLLFRISYFNAYVLTGYSQYNDSIFKHLFFALINAFILFSPLIIFSKTFLRIPAAVILAFFMSFDVGLIYFYKAPMNDSVAASIFETNTEEVLSVFAHVWFVWLPMFAILLFLTLKASVETGKSRKRRLLIRGLCLLADILGIFVLPPIVGKTDFQLFADNIKTSSFSAYYADIVSPKYPFVTGDLFLIAAYVSKSAEAAEIMEAKELPQGVVFRPDTITAISKLIVIVGESARRENHSLYGYPLKTTPFLDSLALQKERLSYFGSVISPSSFTREVLRMTFSFATPSNSDLFLEYANLVRMAKDAGYKTSWISTQNSLGWYNSVMNLIANVADSRYFHEGDDLELIPYIKASIEKGQRQFIVVHINGSHWPYYRFDGDDTKALGTSDEVADYNKTIHHTDRLLREIYRIAGTLDENVLLYYYSDHGEVVGENGAAGHGIPDRYKIQYHVPLVVMQNHPFICADSIVNKYYDGQTGRLNISSNIYILGELMGYHVSDSLIEQSKIDGRYIRQGDASYMLYEKIKD